LLNIQQASEDASCSYYSTPSNQDLMRGALGEQTANVLLAPFLEQKSDEEEEEEEEEEQDQPTVVAAPNRKRKEKSDFHVFFIDCEPGIIKCLLPPASQGLNGMKGHTSKFRKKGRNSNSNLLRHLDR